MRWFDLTGVDGNKCLAFILGIFICDISVCVFSSLTISCSPGWPWTWFGTKDDLELLSSWLHLTVLGFTGCHHTQFSEASFNYWISPGHLLIFKVMYMQANPSLVLNLDFLPLVPASAVWTSFSLKFRLYLGWIFFLAFYASSFKFCLIYFRYNST